MDSEHESPSTEELGYLNSRGFSQFQEGSWKFFKLGYMFDFSAVNLDFVDDIFYNRLTSPYCVGNIQQYIQEQNSC